ncbi:hypothetical protein HYS49_03585 [Candidatus Woesearchaeota archaeon]|nr:hypothetical protein [Candidatus Woesearchaeota archaeon]
MSEELEMQEMMETLESAVSYLRVNLNEFGKRRLSQIYQAGSVENAMKQIMLSECRPEAVLERLVKPTIHFCYDSVRERPNAPEEVYHILVQFWREIGEQTFDKTISTLRIGLEQHPESAMLHADVAYEYFCEMVQEKNKGDWHKVKDYAFEALKYAQRTMEIDPSYMAVGIESVLRLAPKMAETAKDMLSGDPQTQLTHLLTQLISQRK